MTIVLLNKFDGGQAEDVRTFAVDQCAENLNFDVLTKPHTLIPYYDTATEALSDASTITDYKMSDVVDNVLVGSDNFVALGQAGSATTYPKFFSKSTVAGAWTKRAEQGVGHMVINNTLIAFQGLAYALEAQGTGINLIELTDATTINDRGTISNESNACKPFVHPEDNLLYIGAGDQIARYDGTNDIDSATGSSIIITDLMPTGSVVTSLTSYGTYLVIACSNNGGKAIAYLWGRDSGVTTFQGIIDFGNGTLNVVENIGDVIIGIVTPDTSSTIDPKIFVKIWAGGKVQTIKEISVGNAVGTTIKKARSKDRLYFVPSNSDALFVVAKNKGGEWMCSQDRYLANGSTPSSVRGFSIINDYMWLGYNNGSNDVFFRTTYPNYTNTSVYKTTINAGMPLEDRYKRKQLTWVQVAYTGTGSGSLVLKYSVDGSTMTTIISESNPDGEITLPATNESDGKPLIDGYEFQFQIESVGGVQIKEVRYRYEVLNELK